MLDGMSEDAMVKVEMEGRIEVKARFEMGREVR
jgi:hypothetical protein